MIEVTSKLTFEMTLEREITLSKKIRKFVVVDVLFVYFWIFFKKRHTQPGLVPPEQFSHWYINTYIISGYIMSPCRSLKSVFYKKGAKNFMVARNLQKLFHLTPPTEVQP